MASRERRHRMRRTGNRGQVLLVFLAGLLALLGVAALGIDMGYLYTVRHELQRCTDAGALAGASAFLSGNWTDGATRAVADGRARAFATMDNVATTTLSAGSEIAVAFPAAGPGPRRRHPQRQPLLRPPLPRADENRDRLLDRRGVRGGLQRDRADSRGRSPSRGRIPTGTTCSTPGRRSTGIARKGSRTRRASSARGRG